VRTAIQGLASLPPTCLASPSPAILQGVPCTTPYVRVPLACQRCVLPLWAQHWLPQRWHTGKHDFAVQRKPLGPKASSDIGLARACVEVHHPCVSGSVLGGSAAAGTATSASDLDIAVLCPSGHSTYAATTRYRDWLIEAFVHTEESLDSRYQKEAVERRPVIADLCPMEFFSQTTAPARNGRRAREQLARGPMALGDGERDLRRYNLSALIDDLMASREAAETCALASDVFHETADLFLMESAVGLAAANGSSGASASMAASWGFAYAIGLEIPAGAPLLSLNSQESYLVAPSK
jgi:predicted nucleotidyltransferase